MEQIPFNTLAPVHDASIADALLSVLKDNWFILGSRLAGFESEFADFTGVRHCVGTGNGHDALVLAIRALGLGSGRLSAAVDGTAVHEVLVPANTYVATWLAITNAGCVPVAVEPDPETFNMDTRLIEERITSRTKAILPVHLYGNPCDMGAIMDLARKHNLEVIEDNAQAHGAKIRLADGVARTTGSIGHVNATSFYPTKNLGALGDGGAVTTDDHQAAARIRELRNYGFSSKVQCDQVGINSRLDELQAAVLSVKLKKLASWNEERVWLARLYNEGLKGVGDLELPKATTGGTHVYHLYVIRTAHRERLRKHLGLSAIQTMIHYPIPPHLQKAYEGLGYRKGSYPITERLATEVLSLPMWVGMSEGQVQRVCEEVKAYF